MALHIHLVNNWDQEVRIPDLGITMGPYESRDITGFYLPDELRHSTGFKELVVLSGSISISGTEGLLTTQEAERFFAGSVMGESVFTVAGTDLRTAPRIIAGDNISVVSGTDPDDPSFTVNTPDPGIPKAIIGNDYVIVTSGSESITLATDNQGIETFVTDTVLPGVMPVMEGPDTIVYVAKNGSDSTGDGSFHNPYLTVGSGLTLAANRRDGAHVVVYPGNYTEPFNLTVSSGVTLASFGNHPAHTLLVASGSGSTFITMETDSVLRGFSLSTAVTDYAIVSSGQVRVTVDELRLTGGQNGLCFNNVNHTDVSQLDIIVECSYNDVITVSGGAFAGVDIHSHHELSCNNFFKFTGGARCNVFSAAIESENTTNAVLIEEDADVILQAVTTSGVDNSVTMSGDGTKVGLLGCDFISNDLELNILSVGVDLDVAGCRFGSRNKVTFPVGFPINTISFADTSYKDEASIVWGELSVGLPEHGSEAVFGEGDSYVRGSKVFTTDNTATTTGIGGNLTDVSTLAAEYDNSFSFQGTDANHTILVGSTLEKVSDMVKHWGMKINQYTGAVENTPKSFAVEIWDGTTWSGVETMSTERNEYYRYSNNLFQRENSYEQVRYGITEDTQWETTTISGLDLYWARLRITDNLITAPVFERFALHSSRLEINPDGTQTFHGRARFRQTLLATGNIFGESGGVTGGNVTVGSGSLPDSWNHYAKNNVLNGTGDAIYSQFTIPKGTDTSLPFHLTLTYQSITDFGADITFVTSVLPLEVENVLIADPTGGVLPIARPLATTKEITADPGQVSTTSLTVTDSSKIHSLVTDDFDISNFYEGDMVLVRIGLTENTPPADSIFIWALELSGVKWTTGVRQ